MRSWPLLLSQRVPLLQHMGVIMAKNIRIEVVRRKEIDAQKLAQALLLVVREQAAAKKKQGTS
jgi:hypothetical protein